MTEQDILSALKAQQWERAKGELRALVAIQGSQPTRYDMTHKPIETMYEPLLKAVEKFIKQIEDHGLHE